MKAFRTSVAAQAMVAAQVEQPLSGARDVTSSEPHPRKAGDELERVWVLNLEHWTVCKRSISAETLCRELPAPVSGTEGS